MEKESECSTVNQKCNLIQKNRVKKRALSAKWIWLVYWVYLAALLKFDEIILKKRLTTFSFDFFAAFFLLRTRAWNTLFYNNDNRMIVRWYIRGFFGAQPNIASGECVCSLVPIIISGSPCFLWTIVHFHGGYINITHASHRNPWRMILKSHKCNWRMNGNIARKNGFV